MKKMPLHYNEIEDLELISAEDLISIELNASTCSVQDCLDYLFLTESEVPEGDMWYINRAWRKGRINAISTAGDKLFNAMSMRGGGAVALDYLKHMSGTFQAEIKPNNNAKGGFSFNVIMPEDNQQT